MNEGMLNGPTEAWQTLQSDFDHPQRIDGFG
jgi:hypothetical protein